jgi:hypothetical protein
LGAARTQGYSFHLPYAWFYWYSSIGFEQGHPFSHILFQLFSTL